MNVTIARPALARVMALAAASGQEVCGLLLGTPDRIDGILPAPNVAADPARHFELDPAVLIAAHRAARSGGPAIVGHYHSHPRGAPVPSPTDQACATPDGSLWLIVAAGVARLWRAGPGTLVDVEFTEVALDMV